MSGRPVSTFGAGGRIDLRDGLRPGEKRMVDLGAPGVVYKDLLIVGSRTAEILPTPPGDVRAYDVRTGALRWTFHTVPRPGEPGYETWPKDAWTYTGAANNWTGMSLDVRRGLVFVPTGSAPDDFYGANRLGDEQLDGHVPRRAARPRFRPHRLGSGRFLRRQSTGRRPLRELAPRAQPRDGRARVALPVRAPRHGGPGTARAAE